MVVPATQDPNLFSDMVKALLAANPNTNMNNVGTIAVNNGVLLRGDISVDLNTGNAIQNNQYAASLGDVHEPRRHRADEALSVCELSHRAQGSLRSPRRRGGTIGREHSLASRLQRKSRSRAGRVGAARHHRGWPGSAPGRDPDGRHDANHC